MTFTASEQSLAAGVPYELHEFRLGATTTYWRYADAPSDVTYDSNVYTACYCPGGQLEQGATALKQRTIVKVNWDNAFAWQYTIAAPEEIIHYTRYKGHGSDVQVIFMGDVVEVTFKQSDRRGDRWAEISIDPLTAALRRSGLVTRCSRQCDADLYDDRCGVVRETYKVQGTLDSASGTVLTSTTFDTMASGWWEGGDIVVNGRRRWVIDHVSETIRIWPTLPGVAAGQPFDIYPGCDHLLTTCNTKFSNLANNRGMPNIPDDDPWSPSGIL